MSTQKHIETSKKGELELEDESQVSQETEERGERARITMTVKVRDMKDEDGTKKKVSIKFLVLRICENYLCREKFPELD